MDRNTITGFSLIFLILIGYYWYTAPSAEQQAIFQRQRDSIAKVEAAKVTSPTPAKSNSSAISESASPAKDSALLSTIGGFASQLQGKPGLVQLKSKELSIDIRTKGGNIGRVVLNNHRRSDSSVLELLSKEVNDNQWAFELYTANGPLNSADFYWNVVSQTENQVTLRLGDSARYIDQIYSLAADGFTVKHELKLKGIDEIVKSRNSGIKITWRAQLQKQEKDMKWE
ncbi:MAG: hypothetical protein EBQ97_02260, partial [Bacteroidetes bacterium]|nr:hypothetical protein [Bacteroidota bacterium]